MDENHLPVVVGATVIGDRVRRPPLSDGTVGNVDFSSECWTGVPEPLNDLAYFAQAAVDPEAGTVVWPGGIDLAPEPLYEQAKAHPHWSNFDQPPCLAGPWRSRRRPAS